MGFFWGVDQDWMQDLLKKLCLMMLMFEKRIGPKPRIFTVCSGPASQSIGRGRLSREGALDVRESRERRDKLVPFFSPEKQEKRKFWPDFPLF